ncbi:hypothetical protein [Atlantibacter hermannii]|nr:hypothetical protein [Atlantibacter hermannii]MDU7382249.1 hypothetical protein [Enterobacteriaceae bacterium]MDU7390855.1 hypothetical protein [Atlantibacter hermannii]
MNGTKNGEALTAATGKASGAIKDINREIIMTNVNLNYQVWEA